MITVEREDRDLNLGHDRSEQRGRFQSAKPLLAQNLPKEIHAAKVADLYQKRWTIEGRFYEVTQTLDCEPNTLAYPKAALFAFCLALMASNAVALMRASLRAVHSEDDVQNMSAYWMCAEMMVKRDYAMHLSHRERQRFGNLRVAILRHIPNVILNGMQ